MNAEQMPVEDLLRSVPADTRLVIEEDPYGTRYVPIGRLCAEAVEEIATLRAQLAASEASRKELREALEEYRDDAARLRGAQRIYLVPTDHGYERHEDAPPPLCDYELLYSVTPARPMQVANDALANDAEQKGGEA